TIGPSEERREIQLDHLNGAEAQLAAAMLQAELILHLRADQRLARGHRSDRFFLVEPDAAYGDRQARGARHNGRQPAVDIFRGFTFRGIFIAGEGLCLVLAVLTRYIGRRTLADYLAAGPLPTTLEAAWGFPRG